MIMNILRTPIYARIIYYHSKLSDLLKPKNFSKGLRYLKLLPRTKNDLNDVSLDDFHRNFSSKSIIPSISI